MSGNKQATWPETEAEARAAEENKRLEYAWRLHLAMHPPSAYTQPHRLSPATRDVLMGLAQNKASRGNFNAVRRMHDTMAVANDHMALMRRGAYVPVDWTSRGANALDITRDNANNTLKRPAPAAGNYKAKARTSYASGNLAASP
jgi:hypothetical protein